MILAKLKEATRHQHEAVESSVSLMDNDLSLDSYKEQISKFYLFYAGVEPRLPEIELKANGFDLEPRWKLPSLERDLVSLGIDSESLPKRQPRIPEIDDVATAFGAVYVLEGATLGGQVISRHLASSLGLTAEKGAAFFGSYGANVGRMWKEFGRIVTEFAERNDRDEKIIKGAIDTFEAFRTHFASFAKATQSRAAND